MSAKSAWKIVVALRNGSRLMGLYPHEGICVDIFMGSPPVGGDAALSSAPSPKDGCRCRMLFLALKHELQLNAQKAQDSFMPFVAN
jgi:hypothetical protein